MENHSPLRYPGGKTRACKKLDEIINQHFKLSNIDNLIAPFFGGGSFEFYFQNKYGKTIIANDKFIPLYNFWIQVKTDKTQLCNKLELLKKDKTSGVSKELFQKYRESIMNLNDNILEQSFQYFVINRCSFSGATLSGGFSKESSEKRFTLSSIQRIRDLNLENIDFSNYDFEQFIGTWFKKENCDKDLFFVDPPYYLEKKSKLYGNNGDLHENFDHDKLFKIMDQLKDKKVNWIITYNNCTHIRNLYKDYLILDINWSYGMNKSKESSEIVIINSHHKEDLMVDGL
jgi:DNA adenine methylase